MDYGIFNVRTDINACDCTRGITDTVRGSARKVDSRRKIPFRIGESNLRRPRADSMPYQLSYIHTHQPTTVIASQHAVCLNFLAKVRNTYPSAYNCDR